MRIYLAAGILFSIIFVNPSVAGDGPLDYQLRAIAERKAGLRPTRIGSFRAYEQIYGVPAGTRTTTTTRTYRSYSVPSTSTRIYELPSSASFPSYSGRSGRVTTEVYIDGRRVYPGENSGVIIEGDTIIITEPAPRSPSRTSSRTETNTAPTGVRGSRSNAATETKPGKGGLECRSFNDGTYQLWNNESEKIMGNSIYPDYRSCREGIDRAGVLTVCGPDRGGAGHGAAVVRIKDGFKLGDGHYGDLQTCFGITSKEVSGYVCAASKGGAQVYDAFTATPLGGSVFEDYRACLKATSTAAGGAVCAGNADGFGLFGTTTNRQLGTSFTSFDDCLVASGTVKSDGSVCVPQGDKFVRRHLRTEAFVGTAFVSLDDCLK